MKTSGSPRAVLRDQADKALEEQSKVMFQLDRLYLFSITVPNLSLGYDQTS